MSWFINAEYNENFYLLLMDSANLSVHMRLNCDVDHDTISRGNQRGRTNASFNFNGPGELRQVSALFDGSSTDAKQSYFSIAFDGDPPIEYPTPEDIADAHRQDNPGATKLNVITYSKWKKLYGYYIILDSDYDNDVTITFHNGDDLNQTMYKCIALFHE